MMRWLRENESLLTTLAIIMTLMWELQHPRITINVTDCLTAGSHP